MLLSRARSVEWHQSAQVLHLDQILLSGKIISDFRFHVLGFMFSPQLLQIFLHTNFCVYRRHGGSGMAGLRLSALQMKLLRSRILQSYSFSSKNDAMKTLANHQSIWSIASIVLSDCAASLKPVKNPSPTYKLLSGQFFHWLCTMEEAYQV